MPNVVVAYATDKRQSPPISKACNLLWLEEYVRDSMDSLVFKSRSSYS
jgi:hypothetical protein